MRKITEPIQRNCPKFWQAVTRKRYILPQYRQAHYFNQEYLDNLFAFFFRAYLGAEFGAQPDPVIRNVYMAQTMAMEEDRPIYFLESELGDMLMRCDIPLDLVPTELRWIRRTFRVMLPRGLLRLEHDDCYQSVMFLDIGQVTKGEMLMLDPVFERELKVLATTERLLRGKQIPQDDVRPVSLRSGITISGQLTQSEPGVPGIHYAVMRPFEDLPLRDLLKVGEAFDTASPCDVTDDALLAQMQHLAINILIFLGAIPIEYESKEVKEIRKLQVINKRVIPGLWPAKFIGRQLYRPKTVGEVRHDSTGRIVAAHWVKGCWRRQPYGPKNSLRKLIWIQPYAVHPEQMH